MYVKVTCLFSSYFFFLSFYRCIICALVEKDLWEKCTEGIRNDVNLQLTRIA